MRTSIILVREHGKKSFELLAGPETSIAKQGELMRELAIAASEGVHEDYAEAQRWESDLGFSRKFTFMSPKAHKVHSANVAKDEEAHRKYVESLNKQKTGRTAAAPVEAPKEAIAGEQPPPVTEPQDAPPILTTTPVEAPKDLDSQA